jgi:hypothetical protein
MFSGITFIKKTQDRNFLLPASVTIKVIITTMATDSGVLCTHDAIWQLIIIIIIIIIIPILKFGYICKQIR